MLTAVQIEKIEIKRREAKAKAERRRNEHVLQVVGTLSAQIVGRSFYKGNIASIPLMLERQADNRYDSNAIALKSHCGGILGHLPRDVASKIAPLMDQKSLEFDVIPGEDAISLPPGKAQGQIIVEIKAKKCLLLTELEGALHLFASLSRHVK